YAALGTLGMPALDPGVLLFALAVALGTTLLFALVPAIAASRSDLATALKEDDRSGGRGSRTLSTLVVSEVAIACLLLTASGLLIESFARIQSRRTGFVSDDVLTFWVRPPGSRYPPAAGPATVGRLLTRILAVRESDRQARLVRHHHRTVLRSIARGRNRGRRRRHQVRRGRPARPARPRRFLDVVSAVRLSRHDGHRQGARSGDRTRAGAAVGGGIGRPGAADL